jgi:predicted transposase YbfD/YdcC
MAIELSFPTTFKYVVRLDRVKVRLISPDEKDQWNELVQQHHSLHSAKLAGNQLRYVAEIYGKCVALLSFSAPSYHLKGRDEWIGWSEEQLAQRRHFVVQNSRLLIMPDVTLNNLASCVLSLCSKRLCADWEANFHHPVVLIETFVDPAYHRGTCYKASNWIRLGETQGFKRSGKGFYQSHGSPKALWVHPLQGDVQKILSAQELPAKLRAHEKPLSSAYVVAKLSRKPLDSLYDHLRIIKDHRAKKGRRHSLSSCLSIVVCGIVAGCKGLTECAELAKSLNQCQRQALMTRYNMTSKKHEVPSYSTLWRTVAGTDPQEFETIVGKWLHQQKEELPKAICIDGKALRATLDEHQKGHYAVSAVSHNPRDDFFFEQTMVECKSHEDEAARNIIAFIPTLKGVTVTLDALHNQAQTMNLIVDDKQGDFLLNVKMNTPQLRSSIENLFINSPTEPATCQTDDKEHGRREIRTIKVLDITPEQTNWPHTYKAAMLTRQRDIIRQGETISSGSETTYWVSSHQGDKINAEQLLGMARGHWTIENKLHHKKDRSMDEDRYQARNGIARIMSYIKSLVALVLDGVKKTLNVVQRRLTMKPHLLTRFMTGSSLSDWKQCCLN